MDSAVLKCSHERTSNKKPLFVLIEKKYVCKKGEKEGCKIVWKIVHYRIKPSQRSQLLWLLMFILSTTTIQEDKLIHF